MKPTTSVTVVSTTPPASAELDTRAAPGRVRLNVVPADASVYLDGLLLGSGDEIARLHAGLVVEAGSHFSQGRLVEIREHFGGSEKRDTPVETVRVDGLAAVVAHRAMGALAVEDGGAGFGCVGHETKSELRR